MINWAAAGVWGGMTALAGVMTYYENKTGKSLAWLLMGMKITREDDPAFFRQRIFGGVLVTIFSGAATIWLTLKDIF